MASPAASLTSLNASAASDISGCSSTVTAAAAAEEDDDDEGTAKAETTPAVAADDLSLPLARTLRLLPLLAGREATADGEGETPDACVGAVSRVVAEECPLAEAGAATTAAGKGRILSSDEAEVAAEAGAATAAEGVVELGAEEAGDADEAGGGAKEEEEDACAGCMLRLRNVSGAASFALVSSF